MWNTNREKKQVDNSHKTSAKLKMRKTNFQIANTSGMGKKQIKQKVKLV
jgi:hypothetical protein